MTADDVLALVLARWYSREPGAAIETRWGVVVIDHWSPCFRRVHFRFGYDEATATMAWACDFNGVRK